MQIPLASQMRTLRLRIGKTQEETAEALGVTPQAVSRWETGACYPDMELLPSIANFFGVSIDELFGYQGDRDRKIQAIIQKIDGYHIKARGDDLWVDECLEILRTGLAEFPQNERLRITLAETLSEAGWRRHKEWLYYDDEGFMQHRYDTHRKNPYWKESIELCEALVGTSADFEIVTRAISILVLLYRNIGETEKATALARRMPKMKHCREVLLADATEGREEAKYIGELLLCMAHKFAEQTVYGLIVNLHNYETDLPIEKIKGVIALFHLLCDDGNFGEYHGDLIQLYLYLSRVQWERGYHDEAFASLDMALNHAQALEALADGKDHRFTAPLVSFVECRKGFQKGITKKLPEDWPMWCNPDPEKVRQEITADPRWADWVRRCLAQESSTPCP